MIKSYPYLKIIRIGKQKTKKIAKARLGTIWLLILKY